MSDNSLVLQADLDMQFIQRNIRDLSKTAQFSHMAELEELHKLSYDNLKRQLAIGKPLAEDPLLALRTYETLSSVIMQVVETKRRATDTMLKARTVIGLPSFPPKSNGIIDEEEDLPDDEIGGVTVSEEDKGVFGRLVQDEESQPDIAM